MSASNSVQQLLAKATHTTPHTRGLLLEDSPQRRREWGYELYRAAMKVSLTAAQYERIETHYQALQKIIDASDDPLLRDAHIFVQGSIRARTTILPHPDATGDHAEADADAVIWLPNASNTAMDTYDAVDRRVREGTRTQLPPSRKNRCVRLHYQEENPRFHMDVTPARNALGNVGTRGEGHLLVPDTASKGWKPSAPVAYADWFAEVCDLPVSLAQGEQRLLEEELAKSTQDALPKYEKHVDFNPLRAIVKLMKAHRDTMFLPAAVADLRPISIIITTLAARAYQQIARESVMSPRRPTDLLTEIVERMPQFMEGYPGARVVSNPVIAEENFAQKWRGDEGAIKEAAFFEWHAEARVAGRLGLWRFPSEDQRVEALRRAFGPRVASQSSNLLKSTMGGLLAEAHFTRAPDEQLIEERFPVDLRHHLKIDCEVRKSGTLVGRLRNKSRLNRWLPYGRKLRFLVTACDAPEPYDLYWKVRNVGPAADRKRMWRGEIVRDGGQHWKDETTTFSGEHYVEAFVVKNGVCVARDRIQVPIESQ